MAKLLKDELYNAVLADNKEQAIKLLDELYAFIKMQDTDNVPKDNWIPEIRNLAQGFQICSRLIRNLEIKK